ncbi:MAG: ABC transporter ATP-binding protein [Nitrosopumilus sp.]|nr:ABC transporter ATP-binding protein [Nitrosopumilus sp.]MDH3488189.1 ABC transporter ATP-binding protein [Nitrosopumilus sp.]
MNQYAIKLENINKSFDIEKSKNKSEFARLFSNKTKLSVLDNISLKIKKGEFIGIIGRNGSGKTTLLRVMSGIYTPDSGRIHIDGVVAPLLHIGTGFHKELNAKENIIMSGLLLGMKKSEIEQKVSDVIRYAELEKYSQMPLKHYSTGMRARLAFSLVLQIDPDILLVDEILSVGDKKFRDKSFKAFLSFKKKNKTVVLVTHNLGNQFLKMVDRAVLMDNGKIVLIGNPDEVVRKYTEYQDNKN